MLIIRRVIASVTVAAACILGVSGAAFAAVTTQTTVIRIPVSDTVSVICIDEPVLVTGYLQTTVNITQDASGGLTTVQTSTSQNLHGTGLTTGQEYRLVGAPFNNTISHSSSDSGVITFTNEAEANVIGQGQPASGPVARVRITEHVTVDANGNVTAVVSQGSQECF
jgi:hypothetical protein